MVQISRRSWHYRLYRYLGNIPNGPRYLNPFAKVYREDKTPPRSLCPYAWSILLGLVGAVVVGAFIGVGVLVAYTFVYATVVPARAINRAFDRRAAARKPRAKKPPKPKREPRESLLRAAVKAKKDKVCPLIGLVD